MASEATRGGQEQPGGWSCAQVIRASGAVEATHLFPAKSVPCSIPETHVSRRPTGASVFLEMLKQLTGGVGKALWLFVLAIPLKIYFRFTDNILGEYITWFFVLHVLLFFALLALVLAFIWALGPRSKRRSNIALELPPVPSADDVVLELPAPGTAQPHQVVGILSAGGAFSAGTPVVVDRWKEVDGVVVRAFGMKTAWILNQKGCPIARLETGGPVRCYGDYVAAGGDPSVSRMIAPGLLNFAKTDVNSFGPWQERVFCVGDVVTVMGHGPRETEASAMPGWGDGGNYRQGGERMVVLGGTADATLAIKPGEAARAG